MKRLTETEEKAVNYFIENGGASTGELQREFSISYSRAGAVIKEAIKRWKAFGKINTDLAKIELAGIENEI